MDRHSHTASCRRRGTAKSHPVEKTFFNFYTFHLVLLSSLNTGFLLLNTISLAMGLWIFGNGNNGTAHWEPDPSDGRGTWTILSTCIITLTLCVYTSLHLNIPAHKSSNLDAFGMKAKYVISGLLAPELIVFNAWRQRTVASNIVQQVRKNRGGDQPTSFPQRLSRGLQNLPSKALQRFKIWSKKLTRKTNNLRHGNGLPFVVNKDPWADITLVHGFYIVMGGYAFDVSKDTPRIWPWKWDRLTPSAMAVLACLISQDKDLRSVMPYLSEDEIWDKSKANGLAKTIVCIQAAWFCTQCIVRLAQGIPISLLELNTFAHAICALLVYLLWWDKPLDVHEPTVIDASRSETARSICAMAWSGPQAPVPHLERVTMFKEGFGEKIRHVVGLILQGALHSYLGDGLLVDQSSQGSATSERPICAQVYELQRPLALEDRPTQFESLDSEATKSCVWASSDPPVFTLDARSPIPSTSLHISDRWNSVDIDEILLARLKVVEKLKSSSSCVAYEQAFSRILNTTDPDLRMLKPRELNFTDSLMRQTADVSPVGRNLTGATGIVISGLLYGGLHLIAWGSTAFTSHLEDLAWKISCFVVAGGGLFAFAGIFGLDIATKRKQAHLSIDFMKGLVYVSAPLYMGFILLYLICRIYLVFEVIRNLAFLDPQVYKSPEVSN
ncbi:MAG: hypothetical protein Q9195_009419 [Heterodermia aff. obscurata]